jgi:predicted nucleic acid-binding Zn ribbon protein
MATYFDSDSKSTKDYTNIKKVLDDALTGYAKSGGTFERAICRYGKHVFTHITEFPCVKQPPSSQKDA